MAETRDNGYLTIPNLAQALFALGGREAANLS